MSICDCFAVNFAVRKSQFENNEMEAIAKTKYLKGSPRKTRLVIDLIRGVYSKLYRAVHIIDLRYEYEFDGGHVAGAINFPSHSAEIEWLASKGFRVNPDTGRHEDIDGVVSNFAWQWEATARPDGRAYTLADFSPGAIGGIAAMPMSCLTRYIGPGNPVEPTTTRQVQMTPSELRIGDEVLFRHGLGQSTVQASADSVTYTHTDFNPVASFTREYTLRAGLLLSVRWSVVAGGSGSASECVKP